MTRHQLLFFLLITSFVCSLFSQSIQASVKIDTVEPPNWWVGMKNTNLQLMIHGEKIAAFDVHSDSKGWRVNSVERTDNLNYLFVNLVIDKDAKAGNYELSFLKDGKTINKINYLLNNREVNSDLREGFNSSDVIYLITPDRFVNGDYSNDKVDELKEGINRDHEGGRYGGDIRGVIDSLDYIAGMGFTQIWLNPVLQNDQKKYSYHGYSTTDYYQIDKRYGDNQLYKKLSQKGKEKGIGLIKDVILNHIGSAHPWMKDMPSADWINHGNQFTPTTHRREALHDPHATPEDIERFTSGWFVPSMPDLNQRNPMLANYMIQNSIWWVEFAGLTGIRIDTYPYSDKTFLSQYTKALMNEYPNFNLVGEEWTLNPSIIAYWQRGKVRHNDYQSEIPSMMDFPLQDSLVKGLTEKETWSDGITKIYQTLASDFVYADANNLTIFPDNHDMSRIHTQLGHDASLTKMATVFFATTRGIPQYFYGSEVLMDNPGTDSHGIIRSEFPGGWKDHRVSAITGKGLSKAKADMQSFTRKLLNWRKTAKVIHQGTLTHYAPKDGVYVYFRHDKKSKVMVVMNKNNQSVLVDPAAFPTMLKGVNTGADIISGEKVGLGREFKVNAKTALVLELEE